MKLKKYPNNPILSPNPLNEWESLVTCNPAAWYENGVFYLIYRSCGNDEKHIIQLGLATSTDGVNFERVSDKPFFEYIECNFDGGPEDPRICKIDNVYYLTYAYRPYPPGRYWEGYTDMAKVFGCPDNAPVHFRKNLSATGLAFSSDLKSFKRIGRITQIDADNRDVILFPEKINGKYVRLERPMEYCGNGYECDGPSIWLNYSDDITNWNDSNLKLLLKPDGDSWRSKKVGGSTPPLKTEKGWLVLYHGVGNDDNYRVGAMLLDLNDPSHIISNPDSFIMEPEFDYETTGFYNGCVFPTGNVIVENTLYVYYGSGDKYCCLATCELEEIMNFLE